MFLNINKEKMNQQLYVNYHDFVERQRENIPTPPFKKKELRV